MEQTGRGTTSVRSHHDDQDDEEEDDDEYNSDYSVDAGS